MSAPPVIQRPTFAAAFRFWLRLGFISFGGPGGQIAIMHEELVEKRRWISEERFLHALNYCMLLPGPEAQQLATYIGWLLHRTWGGLVAGTLFVLPSAVLLWMLGCVYVIWGDVAWVAAVFYGLKPAVLAIVVTAVWRIGHRALKNEVMWTLAAVAFVAIYFLKLPFPAIVFGAALTGFLGGRIWRDKFLVIQSHDSKSPSTAVPGTGGIAGEAEEPPERPTLARALKVAGVGLSLWWLPVLAAGMLLGWDHSIPQEGIFFSKAALVTFGGAYAVLPYVAQQAVEHFAWLAPGQMLDGLGLAETTPGPLVMVLQFVGFVGAWQHPGDLPPLLAATLGAGLTTWVTFVPCFIWIFLGAPYLESLRGNVHLTTALSAVTAAVVGVILNLAVWFGWHVLQPAERGVDWFAVGIALVALAGLWKWKWDMLAVVAGAGVAGVIGKMLF